MQTEHSPFPPDETLAAYIDGRLDEETRKRVVEHMAECPERLDVVMGGRVAVHANVRAVHEGSAVRFDRRTVLAVAAGIAIAVSTATLLIVRTRTQTDD